MDLDDGANTGELRVAAHVDEDAVAANDASAGHAADERRARGCPRPEG
jgi:hypothetical protein